MLINAVVPLIGHFTESQSYLLEVHVSGRSWSCMFQAGAGSRVLVYQFCQLLTHVDNRLLIKKQL